MENYYLINQTSSLDEYSRSLEYLVPGSTIKSKERSDHFRSSGNGIISSGFFLGNNLTENLAEIEIQNSGSCIISIPLKGKYSISVSNKPTILSTPESGSLILPTDTIRYATDLAKVNDLMIILDYDQVKSILEKNFNTHSFQKESFALKKRSKQLKVIYSFIINTLELLKIYPHLRESLHYKSSLKEVAKLLVVELIADSLNINFKLYNTPDSEIVKKAEELIDANPEKYFRIHEIANKVFTSPRNLQLAFKKHRGTTPMQFLRERKLQKARSLLLNKDSGTLIKEIAFDSGFVNLSSFSHQYQKLFGELPSETLQKAGQNSTRE